MKQEKRCLLIGNTRWHWALQDGDEWHFFHTSPEPEKLKENKMDLVGWASVAAIPNNYLLNPNKQIKTKDLQIKKAPEWLGVDRALGAWAAFEKSKSTGINSEGIMIVDAGTIFSLTKINAQGEFEGGQLVAGLKLQLTAMATGAHNLSMPNMNILPIKKFPFSTSDAMLAGSINALLGTLIEAYHQSKAPIWICGGDAPVILSFLKKRNIEIYHHPNLVLEGMLKLRCQQITALNHS